mmetsp:Transcript_50376/g.100182  ORF Transcript_50376/g.100182 Transcript_50376/m.100182 type:complete len:401 (-) Transcript_50376:447-1649(-)
MAVVCRALAAVLLGAVTPSIHAQNNFGSHCMAWSEVLAKGWTCGGMRYESCTCPEGSKKHSCNSGGSNYYSCKVTTAPQCMSWSTVLSKGWDCGGQPTNDCSCNEGTRQASCITNGKPFYHCKTGFEVPTVPPADVGKAKTKGCTCTEKCQAEGWCWAICGEDGWDYCTSSDGLAPAPAPSPPGKKTVGQYMADFVKSNKGQYVYSDAQGSASCWDLAMRAIEEAAKAGYKVSHTGSSYDWSKQTVSWNNALPGDIMQFQGWRQHIDGYSLFAGNPHTAIVIEAPSGDMCKITAYDQNPAAVHESKYDNCNKNSGHVTIYRVIDKSLRLRLFSADVPPISGPMANHVPVFACAALMLVAAAAVVWSALGRRSGGRRTEPANAELSELAASALSSEEGQVQ